MICGHEHNCSLDWPGGKHDAFGQPCPVAVGTVVEAKDNYFAGAGFVFEEKQIEVTFNDRDRVLEKHVIAIKRG